MAARPSIPLPFMFQDRGDVSVLAPLHSTKEIVIKGTTRESHVFLSQPLSVHIYLQMEQSRLCIWGEVIGPLKDIVSHMVLKCRFLNGDRQSVMEVDSGCTFGAFWEIAEMTESIGRTKHFSASVRADFEGGYITFKELLLIILDNRDCMHM